MPCSVKVDIINKTQDCIAVICIIYFTYRCFGKVSEEPIVPQYTSNKDNWTDF